MSDIVERLHCQECGGWGEWYDNWGMCPCFACFPQLHVCYQIRKLTSEAFWADRDLRKARTGWSDLPIGIIRSKPGRAWQEARSCLTKVRYAAKPALFDPHLEYPYECEFCGGWHFATRRTTESQARTG